MQVVYLTTVDNRETGRDPVPSARPLTAFGLGKQKKTNLQTEFGIARPKSASSSNAVRFSVNMVRPKAQSAIPGTGMTNEGQKVQGPENNGEYLEASGMGLVTELWTDIFQGYKVLQNQQKIAKPMGYCTVASTKYPHGQTSPTVKDKRSNRRLLAKACILHVALYLKGGTSKHIPVIRV